MTTSGQLPTGSNNNALYLDSRSNSTTGSSSNRNSTSNCRKRNLTATTAAIRTGTTRKKPPHVQTSLVSYFGTNNDTISTTGSNSNSTSRMKCTFDPKRYISTSSKPSSSAFGTCPICQNTNIPIHRLAWHASQCHNGNTTTNESKSVRQPQPNLPENTIPTQWNDPIPPFTTNAIKTSAVTSTDQPFSSIVQHSILDKTVSNEEEDMQQQNQQPSSSSSMLTCTEPVPGLFLYENFITEFEEKQILLQLDDKDYPWKATTFNGKHYGQRWGVHCNLRTRQVLLAERVLPKFYRETILPKLQQKSNSNHHCVSSKLKGCIPNEMNAIDYRKSLGHSLSAHVDDRHLSNEVIVNMSLAGDCYMTFTPVVRKSRASLSLSSLSKPKSKDAIRVLLKRRCLQILSGPARYQYTHGIHHQDLLSERRVSLTMRESPITNTSTKVVPTITTRPSRVATLNPYGPSPVTPNSIVAIIPSSITSLSWVKPVLVEAAVRPPTPTARRKRAIFNDTLANVPPGLYIFPDFITEQEENELINQLDDANNVPQWFLERHTGTHREKRWGVDHDLWSRQVRDPIHTIPNWIESIIIQRLQLLHLQNEDINNDDEDAKKDIDKFRAMMESLALNDVNAIEYKRENGHYLGAHIDDRQKHVEAIANLSLAGDCYMEYTLDPLKKKKLPFHGKTARIARQKIPSTNRSRNNDSDDPTESPLKDMYRVYLPRRTLQLLTGRARYEYQHGIHNNDLCSERRISITLRETRP